MNKWVQKILSWFKDKVKKDGIHVSKSISIVPKIMKKPKPTITDKEFFRRSNRKITHCVMHHSTSFDNPETRDWDSIDIYHRSFRMNWVIMVRPITDLVVLSNIAKGKEKNAVKINESYYPLDKVEKFYKKAGALIGEELYVGQYLSKYIKNTKIETPWRKIGYNIGTERANGKLVMRYGRTLMERGAHCYQEGMNDSSIGWLIVGNYDKDYPDSDLWRFCIKVGREIRKEFPGIKFVGHREVKGVKKSCPGELFDMKQFREDLKIRRK